MKLLIDCGNSRIKWAIFSGSEIETTGQQSTQQARHSLTDIWAYNEKPEAIWVSNVAGERIAGTIVEYAKEHWQLPVNFADVESHGYGIKNGYEICSQLGVDRWVAMIGAWKLTRSACCIVDCGTAVTIDVLDQSGQHQGGIIFPGPYTMRRALSSSTHALPEVTERHVELLAQDTQSGIATGCHRAVSACINETIFSAMELYGQMPCLITGGDAEMLIPDLAHRFSHHPELVLEGLAVLAESVK